LASAAIESRSEADQSLKSSMAAAVMGFAPVAMVA